MESKFEVPGTDSYVEVRAKALDKRANVLSAISVHSQLKILPADVPQQGLPGGLPG